MPKLSVIVPVYNTEKYLRECIDSILAQTFTDFELILVDDGSTDKSGLICDEYAKKDERIQVIHQKNGGVTRARKNGVRGASGTYFCFIDSDDWTHPEMFEQMIDKCVETNADIAVCDVCRESCPKSQSVPSLVAEGYYNKTGLQNKIFPTMLMDVRSRRPGILGSLCNKLFHKKVLEQVLWEVDDSFIYAEDTLVSYAALLSAESVYILRKELYHYRQHSESAMHQYNSKRLCENALRSYYEYQTFLQNRGFDISEQLSEYMSINAVDVIRKVLLFDKKTALHKRLKLAREFVSDELVHAAFCADFNNSQNWNEMCKVLLAKKGFVTMLYILFAVRLKMMRALE